MTNEYPIYAKLPSQKILQLEGSFGWEDYNEEFDCGFVPGQGCSRTTEECNFDCPYREQLLKHPAYPNCDLRASDYSM